MSLTAESQIPNDVSLPPPSVTVSTPGHSRQPSTSSDKGAEQNGTLSATASPQKSNLRQPRPQKASTFPALDGDETAWGSNFWVTLVDPQVFFKPFSCYLLIGTWHARQPLLFLRVPPLVKSVGIHLLEISCTPLSLCGKLSILKSM